MARLARLAPDGVAAAVLLRLSRLPAEARAVARAVMLLEPHAGQRYVRELAGVDEAAGALAVDALRKAEILAPSRPLSFVHPLIRQAIATLMGAAELAQAHKLAAHVLDQADADVELVASHLAETEPGGDTWVVDKLLAAGSRALARAAPLAALGHFRRALQEPPVYGRRGIVLLALGRAGFAAQQPECVGYLREAMMVEQAPSERAQAALMLGHALIWAGQASEAGEAAAVARNIGADDRELALALDALELMAQSTAGEPTRFGERLERLGRELDGATKAERVLLSRIALTKAISAFRRPSGRAPRQGPPSTWSWYRRTNGYVADSLTQRSGAHGFRATCRVTSVVTAAGRRVGPIYSVAVDCPGRRGGSPRE